MEPSCTGQQRGSLLPKISIALSLLLLAALVLFLLCTGGFRAMRSLDGFRAYIAQFGYGAHLVFWLCQFLAVVLAPIPGNILSLAGAAVFGFLWGTVLSVTANLLASFFVFYLVRTLKKRFSRNFLDTYLRGKHAEKYRELFTRKRDTFLFLTLLFPFFPDDILCMLAGLTDIPTRRYIWMVVLAKPWGLIAASGFGAAITELPLVVLIAVGVLGVALFVLGLCYGDRVEDWLHRRIKFFLDKQRR